MTRWRSVGLAMALVGLIDGIYLTVDSLNPQVPLYCPSGGIINCVTLTSSAYSRFGGIPVAILGATWFALVLVIIALNRPSLNYALIPLWAIAVVFAGYLIFTELFVLHAICPYCTLAHVLGITLVVPIAKLLLEG